MNLRVNKACKIPSVQEGDNCQSSNKDWDDRRDQDNNTLSNQQGQKQVSSKDKEDFCRISQTYHIIGNRRERESNQEDKRHSDDSVGRNVWKRRIDIITRLAEIDQSILQKCRDSSDTGQC
jgi:hypothetical protein